MLVDAAIGKSVNMPPLLGNENRVQAEGGFDGAGLFQYALVGAFVFPVHLSFSSFVIYKNSPCTPSLHSSFFPNSALRIPNSSLSLPLSCYWRHFFL